MLRQFFTSRLVLVIPVIITIAVYFGALKTGFWGDDYYNLHGLDQISETGYKKFIFSGIAGPSGRPVSLLSFALQHDDWPDNSQAFKRVNFLIHLINGLLIYLICLRLSRYITENSRERLFISLFTAGIWLIHPMQITTVLYVVQRMTQLCTLFILSGILSYLHYQDKYLTGSKRQGIIGMSLAVSVFTTLAILSKENGILLPLFIIVLDKMLGGISYKESGLRAWAVVFLISPLILLLIYFAVTYEHILSAYQSRYFTISERLMTEPVVLFDYLSKIFIPHPIAFSLYNDDFTVSTGLFSPPGTFISLLAIAGMCFLGYYYRRKIPVLGFAVFWFLGGHILESSFVALELYFEHRNYLPILGPCLLAAWFIVWLFRRLSKLYCYVIGLVIYLCVTTVTAIEVHSYQNPYTKAVETASRQPESLRAWSTLMDMYRVTDDFERYQKAYNHVLEMQGNSVFPYLKNIRYKGCFFKKDITEEDWIVILANKEIAEYFPQAAIAELNELVDEVIRKDCNKVNPYDLIYILISLTEKQYYQKYVHMLHELAAMMCIHIGDTGCAVENINQSLLLQESSQKYELKIKILLAQDNYEEAKSTIDSYRKFLHSNPYRYLSYNESYKALQSRVNNPDNVE